MSPIPVSCSFTCLKKLWKESLLGSQQALPCPVFFAVLGSEPGLHTSKCNTSPRATLLAPSLKVLPDWLLIFIIWAALGGTHPGGQRTVCGNLFSPFTTWLSSKDWAQDCQALTHWLASSRICLHGCLCITCVSGAHEGQSWASALLELKLQWLWATMWVLRIEPGPLPEQPVFLIAEQSDSPATFHDFYYCFKVYFIVCVYKYPTKLGELFFKILFLCGYFSGIHVWMSVVLNLNPATR